MKKKPTWIEWSPPWDPVNRIQRPPVVVVVPVVSLTPGLDWTGLDWRACLPACHRPPVRVLWVVANRSGTVINFATARVFSVRENWRHRANQYVPTSECSTIKDGWWWWVVPEKKTVFCWVSVSLDLINQAGGYLNCFGFYYLLCQTGSLVSK
jgi:hypothetical protein